VFASIFQLLPTAPYRIPENRSSTASVSDLNYRRVGKPHLCISADRTAIARC
jgi:hypothetical protein